MQSGRGNCLEQPEIYAKLNGVFRDVFDDDEIVVTPELTSAAVDGWDSLKHIRLLLTLERTFNIKFSAAEVKKLENVGELVSLIQGKS
jgi:acyl carrier protein